MSRTPPDLVAAVAGLHARGWSQRAIGRELGLSRNTVRGIIRRLDHDRTQGHSALPKAPVRKDRIMDEYDAVARAFVEEFGGLTAVRLHELLKREGFVGGYTVVKEYLRQVRPRAKPRGVERFETAPGEQGQQDWSPYPVLLGTASTNVQCFSLILSYSRSQYVSFGARADFYTLIRQHVAAATHFGGLPREILYDGQKSVLLRWEAGIPIYNPRFLAFAAHYGFRPRVVRKPEHKGKIERPFQYIEGNFLNGRRFVDLADLNRQAMQWLREIAEERIHGTTKQKPRLRLAEEQGALLPLPARPYDTAEVAYRVVSLDAFVDWNNVRYSVPLDEALTLVVVRANGERLFVHRLDLECVAEHELAKTKAGPPVVDEGHRPGKRRVPPEQLAEALGELGVVAGEFAAGVLTTQRYRGKHLAAVLALQSVYSIDDLLAALDRAVRYRAFDSATVKRILDTTAQPRALPSTSDIGARERLTAVSKQAHVEPRELDVYTEALRTKQDDHHDG